MGSEELKRVSVSVRGRVQGVSFRYYTQREALQLGLVGWVRNEQDGSVLVVAEGTEEQLSLLLRYLRRGPTAGRVTTIDPVWSEASGKFSSFEIRWL